MRTKDSVALVILALALTLVVIAMCHQGAVGYRDCDTTTCHAVVR